MFDNSQEEEVRIHCESESITTDLPGRRVELPEYVAAELQSMWGYKQRRLPFFGGHPASITKQTCNEIFSSLNPAKQSPLLVCEKTDGVRYLLVIARVSYKDLTRDVRPGEDAPYTEFFLVSRQGTGKLVAYAVQAALSHLLQPATTEVQGKGRSVVSILDGELIKQSNKQIRYLIFDALVHLGKDICQLPLRERLQCATNLLRCSEMLGPLPNPIEVKVKDFFRLTSPKFNMVQFMLKKYVKCLPHQNDGLIFNHQQKKYLRGTTNPGYIKWKPAHLNTVDFMIVPNLNLEEIVGRKVLDLYLAFQDTKLEQYTRQFYAFAIVTQADFAKLHDNYMENESRVAQEEMDRQQNSQNQAYVADPFAGAIIAECRYEITKTDERSVMGKLYNLNKDELVRNIMKQGSEDGKDLKAIETMKNQIYDKGWKIYKLRPDKALPNNTDVVRRIEESIRDGIAEEELIRKNNDLNKLSYGL